MMTRPTILRRGGFLLLELIIAMGLLSLLVGMIVGIARSSMVLSNAVIESRLEESEKLAFIAMMQRTFEQLPGNAQLNLQYEDNGRHYLSTLTLQKVPTRFNWGGQILGAEAFQIVTEPRRDAYLDIVLKVYDEEVLTATGSDYLDVDPVLEVTLLEGVNAFEWSVLDSNRTEPDDIWLPKNRLPMHVIMTAIFEPEGRVVNHTFWIVPKMRPELALRLAAQRDEGNGGDESQVPPAPTPSPSN